MEDRIRKPDRAEEKKRDDSEVAVSVRNVTKKFRLYNDKPKTIKERVLRGGKGYYEDFYALKDVSFEIHKGSTVGLIGQNGCGKSTLLKIINRTLFPNEGEVEIHGRVSSLIELGAGFHPDLSGRENIYTNATIFGLTREEIEKRIPDIIAFSELERFIDNPVRTYSSGMYARLAFSVAIHVDADILLVDEILGVGDMNFQAKCANRIYQMRKSGMTIVIVTHDMGTIDRLCDYAVWLDHGKLVDKGNPQRLQMEYLEFMNGEREARAKEEEEQKKSRLAAEQGELPEAEESKEEEKPPERITVDHLGEHFGSGDVLITGVRMLDEKKVDRRSFQSGARVVFQADYLCQTADPKEICAQTGIELLGVNGTYLYGTNTRIEGHRKVELGRKGTIEVVFPQLQLVEGDYQLGFAVEDANTGQPFDYYHNMVQFHVYSTVHDIGYTRIPHQFFVDGIPMDVREEE